MSDFNGNVSDKSPTPPLDARPNPNRASRTRSEPPAPLAPRRIRRARASRSTSSTRSDRGSSPASSRPATCCPRRPSSARNSASAAPRCAKDCARWRRKGLVEGRTRRGTKVNAAHRLEPARRRRAALAVDRPARSRVLHGSPRRADDRRARRRAARGVARVARADPRRSKSAYRGMVDSTPHDMETCCAHDLALHELDHHRHRQPDADPLRRGDPHRAARLRADREHRARDASEAFALRASAPSPPRSAAATRTKPSRRCARCSPARFATSRRPTTSIRAAFRRRPQRGRRRRRPRRT